jgi:hypothetical protein
MNGLDPWEARWAPYDEATYAAVLAAIEPGDVVLEIGAGDLRLAKRVAARARKVIAWEIQPELLPVAAVHGTAASWAGADGSLPVAAVHGTAASRTDNDSSSWIRDPAAWAVHPRWITDPTGAERASSLEADERLIAVCTDARTAPVPPGVTVAVLLMRHCTHYALYVERLRATSCRRLITNARWGMGVEVIDLGPAAPFDSVDVGWYACRRCGAVGWTGDDAAAVNETTIAQVADVEGCPACDVGVA